MASQVVKGTLSAGAVQWTTGAITVAVTSGGSDAATLARPNKLVAGDYSALPFLTPQAALDAIPKGLNHDVIMTVAAGTYAGFVAHGFVGQGRLKISGATSLATVTTGAASGTAGAGTTTTSMAKPTAAANWTADTMRGKFLKITGGGGASGDANFPTIRPIKTNGTATVSVDAIVGMDSTTTFQIVDMAVELTEASAEPQGIVMRVGIVWCQASVYASMLKVDEDGGSYGILLWNSQSVTLDACDLGASSGFAAGAISCTEAFVNNTLLGGVYNPFSVQWMSMDNAVINGDGRLDAQYITHGTISADALECTGTAIKFRDCVSIALTLNANDCDAVPLDAQNVHNFRVDAGLTGTNATPTRGAVFSKGGQYIVTGATIAGSSGDQFEIEGRAGSWSELSGGNSGTYMSRGTFLHWGTGYTVLQTKFRVEAGESGDDYDEAIFNNVVIGGLVKHYNAWQSLDPAYRQITAHAGGGQGAATIIGYRDTLVVTVATTGDSIRLVSSSEVPYAGGLTGSITNVGANACDVFPPSGKKIYLHGVDQGTDVAIRLAPGQSIQWTSRNDLDYAVQKNFYTTFPGITATSTVASAPGVTGTGGSDAATPGVLGIGTGSSGKGVRGDGSGDGEGGYFVGGSGGGTGVYAEGGVGDSGVWAHGAEDQPGLYADSSGNGGGVLAFASGTGAGVEGIADTDGAGGVGVKGTGAGTGAGVQGIGSALGTGVQAFNDAGGVALEIISDPFSPVRASVLWMPQDAQPTGAHQVGHMYVSSAGVLNVCVADGTPGTWAPVANSLRVNVPRTSSLVLVTGDSGKTYTNAGASGDIVLTLPTLVIGQVYRVRVLAAFYIKVLAVATDQIYLGANLSAAAGYVRSNIPGACLEIEAVAAGIWAVTSLTSVWTQDV